MSQTRSGPGRAGQQVGERDRGPDQPGQRTAPARRPASATPRSTGTASHHCSRVAAGSILPCKGRVRTRCRASGRDSAVDVADEAGAGPAAGGRGPRQGGADEGEDQRPGREPARRKKFHVHGPAGACHRTTASRTCQPRNPPRDGEDRAGVDGDVPATARAGRARARRRPPGGARRGQQQGDDAGGEGDRGGVGQGARVVVHGLQRLVGQHGGDAATPPAGSHSFGRVRAARARRPRGWTSGEDERRSSR